MKLLSKSKSTALISLPNSLGMNEKRFSYATKCTALVSLPSSDGIADEKEFESRWKVLVFPYWPSSLGSSVHGIIA